MAGLASGDIGSEAEEAASARASGASARATSGEDADGVAEMFETWAGEEMVAVPAKSARARRVLRGKRGDSIDRTKNYPE
jgi:hypothetical protein